MLNKVQTYIEELNMISEGDRIVIGVSGGADSVCLFHVLLKLAKKLKLTLFVVHINHGIRGEEADEDEAYVKELCDTNGISFTVVKEDVPKIAKEQGLTEEEAGRKVRYEAFYKCFEENRCNKIAIAHNRNDNAETFLFHLFRGSGIKGLTGIPPIRDEIIRPLLCISRQEIEEYLKENNIRFCTDRTNLTLDYSRNKIRHHIINFAKEEINSNAVGHIVNAAGHLEEINRYLEKNIKIAYDRVVTPYSEVENYEINTEKFNQEELIIQRGIIRLVIYELAHQLKDVEALHINLVLALKDKEVGKSLDLPYGIVAVRKYHSIRMSTRQEQANESCEGNRGISNNGKSLELTEPSFEIKAPGDYYLPQLNSVLHVNILNYEKNMLIPKNCCTKWFDYDKIKNTVLIRNRQEGDFLQIDSKGSRKKIKSLFIDDKVPREERDLLPLLADESHIMWVVGGRMSEAYKITQDTKLILEIRIDGGKRDGRQD